MDVWVTFWSALTNVIPSSGLGTVAAIVLLRSAAVPILIPAGRSVLRAARRGQRSRDHCVWVRGPDSVIRRVRRIVKVVAVIGLVVLGAAAFRSLSTRRSWRTCSMQHAACSSGRGPEPIRHRDRRLHVGVGGRWLGTLPEILARSAPRAPRFVAFNYATISDVVMHVSYTARTSASRRCSLSDAATRACRPHHYGSTGQRQDHTWT
jgi:hypothetical protein